MISHTTLIRTLKSGIRSSRNFRSSLSINLVPNSFPLTQVALLKEERSNLLVENEDLCEKVRAAQTLSRKVSSSSI